MTTTREGITPEGRPTPDGLSVTLEARAERNLIRTGGSYRHVDFGIKVAPAQARAAAERLPLSIGLVLDRSGSMAGEKLVTAKQAALAVLEQIDERDTVAMVTFDDQIVVLQPAEPATAAVKARIRTVLDLVEAR